MSETAAAPNAGRPPPALWKRALPWVFAAACFAYLYTRISGAAAREGQNTVEYLGRVFADVDWLVWLSWMIPYSFFFFLVDTAVLQIRWSEPTAGLPGLSILGVRSQSTAWEAGAMVQPITAAPSIRVSAV